MKQLSDEYHTPFVCVNQVSDFFSKRPEHIVQGRQVIPALGLAWSEQASKRHHPTGTLSIIKTMCMLDSMIVDVADLPLRVGCVRRDRHVTLTYFEGEYKATFAAPRPGCNGTRPPRCCW